MYVGIACVAPPTASPRKMRLNDRAHQSPDTALSSTPAAKMTATTMIVRRRPSRPTSALVASAPMTAPSRIEAVMTSVMLCAESPKRPVRSKSSDTCSIAPAMTPVS